MTTQRKPLTLLGKAGRIQAILEWIGDAPDDIINPVAVAIIAHPHPLHGGTMDNKVVQTLAKAFMECGMVVLRFNFRGVGESEGSYDSGQGECDDMVVLADWLRNKFPGKPLYAGGFSFGAFVTVNAHATTSFERMVLVGAAVGRFNVAPVPTTTIIIHGSLDDTVPLLQVLTWAEPQQLIVHVIAGADHFFHQRLIPLRHLIISMLRDSAILGAKH